MPGLPAKQNNQVALPADNLFEQNAQDAEQPRQPQNLQGLLRFAMEAQNAGASNDRARALDDESKIFLEEALKSMTVDVIDLMKKQIEILKDVENITEEDVEEKLGAFDTILEYIDNVDIANDFHKINGFLILDPCLRCKYHQIRAAACDLIAELSQNNPYIQNVVCNCTNLLPTLLNLLETDTDEQVQIKALYAISCVTRDSELGYKNFIHHNGLKTCLKALEKNNDKLRTKIAFLLSSVNRLDDDLIKNMVSLNYLPALVELIRGEWKSSHEHVLSLLHLIAEKDGDARAELQCYGVKDVINAHLVIVQGKDEFKEEEFYCKKILELVFS